MIYVNYSSRYKRFKLSESHIFNALKYDGLLFKNSTERPFRPLKRLRIPYKICVGCDNLDSSYKWLGLSGLYICPILKFRGFNNISCKIMSRFSRTQNFSSQSRDRNAGSEMAR